MENYIFYNYLKWRKESKNGTMHKIMKMPFFPKVLIILLLSCGAFSIISLFFSELASLSFIIAEVVFGIITFFYSEKMFVDNSPQKYQDYKQYCNELSGWLSGFGISSKEQLSALKERIDRIVDESQNKSKLKRERAEKWLQVLLIPIILAVANNIINSQTDINKVIAYIISIMIVFLSIYSATIALVAASSIFDNWNINKFELFANDLQSILVCMLK